MANEKWLLVIQTAYRSDPQPAPLAPGGTVTYTVVTDTLVAAN